MADLMSLVQQLVDSGQIQELARNPFAQFGTPRRPLLGASLLPERLVEDNLYRETSIRWRTIVALDGTRYSPAQKRADGQLVGEFLVELGHQDIAREMTGRDYDALLKLLDRNASMDAVASILRWVDVTVNQALVQRNEIQRWQAIVDAKVVRVGDNGYAEEVEYPNPSNHRASAGGTWSSDQYDPYDDIVGMADLLAGKGYTVGRIVTSRKVASILAKNANIAKRAAPVIREVGGEVIIGRTTLSGINAALQADGLPPIELYDATYEDMSGRHRYLPDDVFVMVADTGVDPAVAGEPDEGDTYLPETLGPLGYTAIGRAVGQAGPGRVIRLEAFENKPPRLEAEGWQTSLPVITEPEAIAVIKDIA